jgi:hypothetical protein
MAKEIKPNHQSGAARFLGASESGQRVEFRGLTGRLNVSQIAELHGPTGTTATAVPRPLEKVKREFVLTRETDAVITEVVGLLRETTTARLSSSHVLRGLARLLMDRLPALRAAAVASGHRRLPSTSPNHLGARVEFERFLASIFELALHANSASAARISSSSPADKPIDP